MDCRTATRRVPFSFRIDGAEGLLIVTSDAGNDHAYWLFALRDTYDWLKNECGGNWVPLGSMNEQNEAAPGTVEAWARDENNPVGGFYGVINGNRGRFASYVPAVLELMGFVELEGRDSNNRVRAL